MKKYIILFILLITVMACNKELDQVNTNQMPSTIFWKTDNDFNSALAASYKIFKDVNNGYWGVRGVETTNGRGDDFFIRNDVSDLYRLSTFTNSATTGVPGGMFTGFYTAIFRANQVIKYTQTAQLSDSSKKQYIAEAKFIRGVNYFHIAINFGDAPIITKVPDTQNPSEFYSKKSTVSEVYNQAISDLKAAKDSLPLSYPATWIGKASRGSAIGYLGKVYVYMKNWAAAENEFKLLAKTDGTPQAPFTYDLLTNYADNFDAAKDNNMESLFEIQVQDVGGNNPWAGENANEGQGVTTAQEFAPTEVAGWYEAYATEKMFNEFQKEKTTTNDFDPRMYASIVWQYPGAMYYNIPFDTLKDAVTKKPHYSLPYGFQSRIRKYQNWKMANEQQHNDNMSDINEKSLRYADILLMYAEAVTEQQRPADAYPLVNRIRTRASLAPLTAGFTHDQMMAEIQHQRMVEFFREGLRFYDLQRWGLAASAITASDKEGKENYTAKFALFPIPQAELDSNPNMTQNDAWK